MARAGDNDDFLSRWSRRKRDVAERDAEEEQALHVKEAEAADPVPAELSENEQMALFRQEEPELAQEIDRLDIDSLKYEDDFAVFMKEKVPEFLRRKALSKLWLSSPLLANVDGLVDYDDDFTDAATVLENFQSAYQPGRGYRKAEKEEPDEELADISDETPEETAAKPETDDIDKNEEKEVVDGESESNDELPDSDEDDSDEEIEEV